MLLSKKNHLNLSLNDVRNWWVSGFGRLLKSDQNKFGRLLKSDQNKFGQLLKSDQNKFGQLLKSDQFFFFIIFSLHSLVGLISPISLNFGRPLESDHVVLTSAS